MREFKFRAWHKQNNCMVDWDFLCSVLYGGNKLNDRVNHDNIFNDPDYTVMQYIGRQDKNNEDIYEGDIVTDSKNKSWKSEIIWLGTGFGFSHCHPSEKTFSELLCDTNRLIVVGNKFENNNLLWGDVD